MSRKRIAIALVAVLVAGLAAYALWFGDTPAPSFSYTTLNGQQANSRAFDGKVVLVNFWATSCSGCVEEMAQMKDMYRHYAPAGFTVLAVAMNYDNPDYIRTFATRNGLPFAVSHDRDGSIAKAFGDIQLTPTTFLIDRRGRIVKRYVGVMDFNEVRRLIADNTAS